MLLKALADETRLRIFNMLSSGELCACKILECFDITQPTLSYHMKVLCDSGLVEGRRDGVWMRYSLNRDALAALRNLFADIEIRLDQDDYQCNEKWTGNDLI
ncbi:MAG: ArsR/SmtB family transcription factor [Syntrophomonadales bacterium]|jgi:ArsR family transcriptional regulator